MRQIGAYLQFVPNLDGNNALGDSMAQRLTPHDAQLVQQIRQLEHVTGMDPFNVETHMFCSPIGFHNSKKHTGETPAETETMDLGSDVQAMSEGVLLFGIPDILVRDEFRRGFSHLTEGVVPTDANPGLLVNSELVQENKLKLGDTLELQAIDEAKTQMKAKIVGIYETKLKFEILPGNIFGPAVYAYGPFNRIYTNYSFVCAMSQRDPALSLMRIYVDSPENLQTVQAKIENMDVDWEQYRLINGTETHYKMVSSALIQVFAGTRKVLLATLASLLVIAVLFSFLWNQNESYELSVLLALGERKRKIILERVLRHALITAAAYLVALPFGYGLLRLFVLKTPLFSSLRSSLQSSGSFYTGEFSIQHNFHLAFSVRVFLYLFLFALVLVVIFNIRAWWLLRSKQAAEIVVMTQEE